MTLRTFTIVVRMDFPCSSNLRYLHGFPAQSPSNNFRNNSFHFRFDHTNHVSLKHKKRKRKTLYYSHSVSSEAMQKELSTCHAHPPKASLAQKPLNTHAINPPHRRSRQTRAKPLPPASPSPIHHNPQNIARSSKAPRTVPPRHMYSCVRVSSMHRHRCSSIPQNPTSSLSTLTGRTTVTHTCNCASNQGATDPHPPR